MGNFMAKFLRSSFFGAILLAILGAFLFFDSEDAMKTLAYIVGGILIAMGVISLIKYMVNKSKGIKNELDIVYGLCIIILGAVVCINPDGLAGIIPFVIGIVMIISSSAKIYYGLELKRSSNPLWKETVIVSLITLLCGVFLVFNPITAEKIIFKVVGAIMFAYAILDIVLIFKIRKTVKNIFNDKQITVNVVEADVIEDNTKDIKEIKKQKDENKGE